MIDKIEKELAYLKQRNELLIAEINAVNGAMRVLEKLLEPQPDPEPEPLKAA